MNDIFRAQLMKFVLVFFDDILVYSQSMEDYIVHLSTVLGILVAHQLFANATKCQFGQEQLEYLGHIISHEGVASIGKGIRCVAEVAWALGW